jgi:hypothetical protein
MAGRGAGCWESRLSGSVRGWVTTQITGEILWHRWETRRQTEKTNLTLTSGEFPAYSNSLVKVDRTEIAVRVICHGRESDRADRVIVLGRPLSCGKERV